MSWISYGEIHLTADELIADRTIPPIILVTPDGGNSRYINNCDRPVCYEDFFFQEFMPAIEEILLDLVYERIKRFTDRT